MRKHPSCTAIAEHFYFAARPSSEDQEKGHKGIGGYDIFFSKLNDSGVWEKPKNIGNPLNTDQDEHGLIVSADGHTAYFASARYQGAGDLDIFGFQLPKEVRPDEVTLGERRSTEREGELVRDATVEIEYMDSRKIKVIQVDSASGQYATVVKLAAGSDVNDREEEGPRIRFAQLFTRGYRADPVSPRWI